jgi:hypothetical protein
LSTTQEAVYVMIVQIGALIASYRPLAEMDGNALALRRP